MGKVMYTIENMIPMRESGCKVEVISFEEMCKGEPAAKARYNWSLAEIQQAIFVRFLEGKCKGKVAMHSKSTLRAKREPKNL